MKKHLIVIAVTIFAVTATVLATKLNASENNSQLFSPARYSLVAAEINASMLQNSSSGRERGVRKVLLKLDSVTGEVWILQLSVMGGNDSKVREANWFPVKRSYPEK